MNHNNYNILLVDDDTPIRESICKKINNLGTRFFVKYQASNGVEALEYIKNDKDISLLITDVQMPNMNGLDLIKNVMAINPQIQTAIISGYDEFSYVTAAIRSGASDYLLKPIDDARLNAFLTETAAKLDLLTQHQQSMFIMQTLKGLTISQISRLSAGPMYIAMFNYGNLTQKAPFSENIRNLSNALNEKKIKDFCNDAFRNFSSVFIADGISANQKFIIVSSNIVVDGFDIAVKKLHSLLNDVICPVSVFYQQKPININDLLVTVYKLQNLSSKLLVMGKAGVYDIDAVYKSMPPINISFICYRFGTFLKNCDYEMFRAEFVEYFVTQIKRNYTQHQIEDALISLFCFLQNNQPNFETDSIMPSQDMILENCAYITNPTDAMNAIAEVFFNCFAREDEKNIEKLIRIISDYIDAHFSEQLTIDALAKRFNYSSSWLIKSFKKYNSSTINDYITNARISEAKKLLSTRSELSIRKIAEMCGYIDQQYFSRVFQKTTGMSPSVFRNSKC